MGYPVNVSSAKFDACATTDKYPTPTEAEVMAVRAKNSADLTRTVVASIEQILFAEFGRSARMSDAQQVLICAEFQNSLADVISHMTDGAEFTQYISEIE